MMLIELIEQSKVVDMGADLFVARDVCPVCAHDQPATLFSAPYTDPRVRGHVMSHYRDQGTVNYSLLEGIDFTIFKCSGCSLIYQRMAPTGGMLDVLYNQFIDPEQLKRKELARLTLDNFTEVGRRLGDLFRTIGKEPKDITLLDYGFGYGRWARVAAAMGAQVFATEITPEKIAFARSIGVAILNENDLPNHRFDVVHAEQIFEHLANPADVFDMLAQCVADGGVFKIAVPKQGRIEHLLKTRGFIDYSPFARGFKGGMSDYQTVIPLEHVNSFRRKPIEVLASRADLIVRTGGFGARHLDLDLGSIGAIMSTTRQWATRVAKDLYNHIGPGVGDNSCYLLSHRGER
jgi:SAM-dependent methyltransferase